MPTYETDRGLTLDVHSPSDLLEALSRMYDYAIEDLEGDPLYEECLKVLNEAAEKLRALGVEMPDPA